MPKSETSLTLAETTLPTFMATMGEVLLILSRSCRRVSISWTAWSELPVATSLSFELIATFWSSGFFSTTLANIVSLGTRYSVGSSTKKSARFLARRINKNILL